MPAPPLNKEHGIWTHGKRHLWLRARNWRWVGSNWVLGPIGQRPSHPSRTILVSTRASWQTRPNPHQTVAETAANSVTSAGDTNRPIVERRREVMSSLKARAENKTRVAQNVCIYFAILTPGALRGGTTAGLDLYLY
jgi:hypothetical protein